MSRRRVRIPVSYVLLDGFLKGHTIGMVRAVITDVPDDLVVVGVTDDPYRGVAYLHCESATFAEVPEIADPPEWTPTYRLVAA